MACLTRAFFPKGSKKHNFGNSVPELEICDITGNWIMILEGDKHHINISSSTWR